MPRPAAIMLTTPIFDRIWSPQFLEHKNDNTKLIYHVAIATSVPFVLLTDIFVCLVGFKAFTPKQKETLFKRSVNWLSEHKLAIGFSITSFALGYLCCYKINPPDFKKIDKNKIDKVMNEKFFPSYFFYTSPENAPKIDLSNPIDSLNQHINYYTSLKKHYNSLENALTFTNRYKGKYTDFLFQRLSLNYWYISGSSEAERMKNELLKLSKLKDAIDQVRSHFSYDMTDAIRSILIKADEFIKNFNF